MFKKIVLPIAATLLVLGQPASADEDAAILEDTFSWYGSYEYIGHKTLDEVAEELINELIAEGDITEDILLAQR